MNCALNWVVLEVSGALEMRKTVAAFKEFIVSRRQMCGQELTVSPL